MTSESAAMNQPGLPRFIKVPEESAQQRIDRLKATAERAICQLQSLFQSSTTMPIPTGRYRHYKGKDYFVLGLARHSETQEELVVYRQDYGDRRLWVRPLAMFRESVMVEGNEVPRFEFVEPGSTAGDEPAPSI